VLATRYAGIVAMVIAACGTALADAPPAERRVVCGRIHADSAQCPLPEPNARLYVGRVAGAGRKQRVVQGLLRRQSAQLNYCYLKFQLVDAKLAGLLKAKLTVNPSGEVTAVATTGIESDVRADLVKCVTDAVSQVVFPRLGNNDVVITVPLILRLLK